MIKISNLYPLLIALLVLLVYIYGINGSFQHDDLPNIVENKQLHIKDLTLNTIVRSSMSSNSGILRRPVSMSTFAINYYFSGLNPHIYKATNVVIHAINAIALYWLCLLLLKNFKPENYNINNRALALMISLAWSLHPINLTAVLYVVQRMTSLAALFTILAMGFYIKSRNKLIDKDYYRGFLYLAFVIILGLMGVFSKENALLLFVYLFLLEIFLYKKNDVTNNYNKIILSFFTVFLFLPIILLTSYMSINPDWIFRNYDSLSFGPIERLLTESRIVWVYVSWIVFPNNKNLGLFHDNIEISRSIFDSTLPVLPIFAHLVTLIILAYLWRKKSLRLFALGFLLFYASHLMESTFLPLMLIFEHRNYFGSFGLILAIFTLIFSTNIKYRKYCLFLSISLILLLATQTTLRSIIWADSINYALVNIENHPDSAQAHYELGLQYSKTGTPDNLVKAKQEFILSSNLDKKQAAPLFALLSLSHNDNDKKTLDKTLFDELLKRLNTESIYATNIAWINRLTNCYIDNKCMIEKEQIEGILHAIITNNKLKTLPIYNSYILMMKARILASIDNDYESALKMAKSAANSSPKDIRFAINIYHLAMSRNDFYSAQNAIDIMNNLSTKTNEKEIKDFMTILDNARKNINSKSKGSTY